MYIVYSIGQTNFQRQRGKGVQKALIPPSVINILKLYDSISNIIFDTVTLSGATANLLLTFLTLFLVISGCILKLHSQN